MKHLVALKFTALVTFTYFHLLHPALISANLPNNNELYAKTCNKELETNELLHTYETTNSGCTLECYILKTEKNKDFFTQSETRRHLLSNIQCINETYVSTLNHDLIALFS